ncbi:hypothetical protein DPMN_010942 [Dreissena polymorpha]|uniref:Uncharacterized protein n=1 Tax=Dreissena polymorpha TaxID=45954 RepID=A0A9D4N427_DREPO|nr:hypothetical protein DPMN_010942 [Dreissena polymorpha]
MLTALKDVTSWARMKSKAAKSRSLIIKKGKPTDRFTLKVQIPLIMKSPIKCLGKWFDKSEADSDRLETTKANLANDAANLANDAAYLANDAANLANDAAYLANGAV